MNRKIDPITSEVIQNSLDSTADEMALVIVRSAYSPVVRDTMDFSTALCSHDGLLVAQGLSLAIQLGAFPHVMRTLVFEATNIQKGDVFIANDPYGSGGQHLPDIFVIKPIFYKDKLQGYASTMAHHSDVGGIAPGSVAIHAVEIFQEGLRLPLLKLFEAGKENKTLFSVIEKNTRSPVQVIGDLRAQVAACEAGEKGMIQLLKKYGPDEVRFYLEEMQNKSERMMRAEISAIPDGTYIAEDFIDGVGENPQRLRIAVSVKVDADTVSFDFTGTAEQIPAALNCPISMAESVAYCAIRCIGSTDIPNCEGYMRPVSVFAPQGTIVNPVLPAACGARGVVGYRVFDVIMKALAPVVPEKVIAAGEGGPTLVSVGGYHQGRPFVLTEVMVGTWGARAGRDGLEGISNPIANLSNQPVEFIEQELPLRINRYGLVPDSGGAGRFRGGLAFEREFEFLSDQSTFNLRADRRDHPPYGLEGGEHGAPSSNIMFCDSKQKILPGMPMEQIQCKKGDIFHHVSAGGGGFGCPWEREPAQVLADVLEEKVGIAAARDDYGVVIDSFTMTVDARATDQLRRDARHQATDRAKARA